MPTVITGVSPGVLYPGMLLTIDGSGFGTTDCNFTLNVKDHIDGTHPNGYFYAIVTAGHEQTDTQQQGTLPTNQSSNWTASSNAVVYAFNNTTSEKSNEFPVTVALGGSVAFPGESFAMMANVGDVLTPEQDAEAFMYANIGDLLTAEKDAEFYQYANAVPFGGQHALYAEFGHTHPSGGKHGHLAEIPNLNTSGGKHALTPEVP